MNRMFSSSLFWIAGLIWLGGPEGPSPLRAAGPPPPPIDQRKIASLVEQLGAEKFSERQAASKELLACGRPALRALHKATNHDDPEIRDRARKLIKVIDDDVNALRARGVLNSSTG